MPVRSQLSDREIRKTVSETLKPVLIPGIRVSGTVLQHPVEKQIEKFGQPHSGAGVFLGDATVLSRHRHQLVIPDKRRFAISTEVNLTAVDLDIPGVARFSVERFWNVIEHERVSGKRVATGADRMTRGSPFEAINL